MKNCSKCKESKDISEFQKEKTGKVSSICKVCKRILYKDWEKRNPEKRKAIHDKYYNNKKDEIRWKSIKEKYGLTKKEYDKMLIEQNYCCKICGSKESKHKNTDNLLVDHCHKTLKVRGLLCNSCNTVLGFINDRIDVVDNIKKYLS